METIYRLVLWPDSQVFMGHARKSECLCVSGEYGSGLADDYNGALMVPVDLYVEVTRRPGSPWGEKGVMYDHDHDCPCMNDELLGSEDCTCISNRETSIKGRAERYVKQNSGEPLFVSIASSRTNIATRKTRYYHELGCKADTKTPLTEGNCTCSPLLKR